MTVAKLRCLSCGHIWYPENKACTCKQCGAYYVEWLNYEQWRDAPERSLAFRKVYPCNA